MKTPRISARGLILKGNSVLVTENIDELGFWYVLPGGGQQFGEDLIACLKREIFEETGLHIQVGTVRFIREFISRNHIVASNEADGFHSVEITFICELADDRQDENLCIPAKPDPYQIGWTWIDLDQLETKRFYPRKLVQFLKSMDSAPIYIGESQ
jgi:8-oxo-dGTP pyrophosphatase MutT (NUDIX family)